MKKKGLYSTLRIKKRVYIVRYEYSPLFLYHNHSIAYDYENHTHKNNFSIYSVYLNQYFACLTLDGGWFKYSHMCYDVILRQYICNYLKKIRSFKSRPRNSCQNVCRRQEWLASITCACWHRHYVS